MGPSGSAASGSRTPVVALQAALTAATTGDDKTVTVNGTSTSPVGTATLSGQEEFSPSFGLSMTDTEDGAAFSEIWIGDTVYLKVPQYAGMLGAGGAADEKIDAWIAADDLPVRITIAGTGTDTGSDADSADAGTSQLYFSNWGRPVNIAAPPSDEVENPGSLGGSSNLPSGI